MSHKFTDHEVLTIQEVKKRIRNGVSKALLPINHTLRTHLINNCIVTGGCSASTFYNQEPNDWDLLFKDEVSARSFKNYINALMYYINEDKEDVMDAGTYTGVHFTGKLITANAVTLKNKVQVIDWKWQRNNFDFIHCMPWYDLKEDKYNIASEQYDAIKNKQLIARDPDTFKPNDRRLKKWLDRGFTIEFKVDELV
jgi:hypothetical protein